jgi:hypothetical protein
VVIRLLKAGKKNSEITLHYTLNTIHYTLHTQHSTLDQVVIRLLKAGKKNSEITPLIEKCLDNFGCKAVDGVVSHQIKRFTTDGTKVYYSLLLASLELWVAKSLLCFTTLKPRVA